MLLMKDYSADKAKKKADKVDKKYIKSIIWELKNYGFSFVAKNERVIDTIKEIMPNVEINNSDSQYMYFVKVVK